MFRSYFALFQPEAARLDEADFLRRVVVRGAAPDVAAWVIQAEAAALQRGEHGVSQSRVEDFWVVILDLIHPTLKTTAGLTPTFIQQLLTFRNQ